MSYDTIHLREAMSIEADQLNLLGSIEELAEKLRQDALREAWSIWHETHELMECDLVELTPAQVSEIRTILEKTRQKIMQLEAGAPSGAAGSAGT